MRRHSSPGRRPVAVEKVRGRPTKASRTRAVFETRGEAVTYAMRFAAVRVRLGMTQAQFGKTFGFSTAAVRSFEQGIRQPSGPAATVLKLIERDAEFVRTTLAKAD